MLSNHCRAATAWLFVAVSLASVAVRADTLQPPAGVSAGPCVEGVCEYRLGNGMRVLLLPDDSASSLTLNLVYGVGSAHESYGEGGMAHLLEHMLFKGTPNHRDIFAEMRKRGIASNAATSFDYTHYHASFVANDATLDWLLALEADRMVNSRIAREDLDREMTVVRNEMEQDEDDLPSVLYQSVASTAYQWHHYGRRVIGARSDVENVPVERLRAFYRAWYRPDNATLVIAGRLDPATTLKSVARRFGKIAKPAAPLRALYTAEPAQAGERGVSLRRVGDFSRLVVAYHMPAATHADTPALQVLAEIMQGMSPKRSYSVLVGGGHALSFGAWSGWSRDPGLWLASLTLNKDGDMAATERILLGQLEALAGRPIDAEEVAAARQRLRREYDTSQTGAGGLAIALTEAIGIGDWRLYFRHRDALEQVDAEQANRVARLYLRPANRTLGRLYASAVPERVVIPKAPSPEALLRDYVGKADGESVQRFDASLANLRARARIVEIDTGSGQGLRLALLPKSSRNKRVVLNAMFEFGDAESVRGREAAGAAVGALLGQGHHSMDGAQLAAELDKLKATVRIGGALQSAFVSLSTQREHLAKTLFLTERLLRTPLIADSHVEQYKQSTLAAAAASCREPSGVIGEAMSRHFDPPAAGDPKGTYDTATYLAAVRNLTGEQARAFHRDHYGTAEGTISVVGDFDPVEVERQLRELFGTWKAPRAFVPASTRHAAIAAERRSFQTPDKDGGLLWARSNLPLSDGTDDALALSVADRILGGHSIDSRLGRRIRDQDGLSYTVRSGLHADSSPGGHDDAGYWTVYATSAPQNLMRVERSIREELDRLLREGVRPDEVRDALTAMRTEREQARSSDEGLAGFLGETVSHRLTLQSSAERDARLDAMTADTVNAAIRKYLKPEQFSFYLAGDFEGAGKNASAAEPSPQQTSVQAPQRAAHQACAEG